MSINDRKTGALRRQSITPLTDYITGNKIQIPFENPAGGKRKLQLEIPYGQCIMEKGEPCDPEIAQRNLCGQCPYKDKKALNP